MSVFIFLALMCLLAVVAVSYVEIEKLCDHVLDLDKDIKNNKKGKK